MTVPPGAVYLLIGLACLLSLISLVTLFRRGNGRKDRGKGEESWEALASRIEDIGQIRSKIEELQMIFSVPHLRGGVGETLLGELLANWLPKGTYELQYSFQTGERVDAVIFLGDYKIAVDAKFPLESVRRALEEEGPENPVTPDVRRALMTKVEEISKKYIRPSEGTLQFALMYIPSERIYYHTFVEKEYGLMEQALRQGVVPVSPSGMFLYIQTVAYGLRGLVLPEGRKEFARTVYRLEQDFTAFQRSFSITGTHMKNLSKSFEDTLRKLDRLEQGLHLLGNGEKDERT